MTKYLNKVKNYFTSSRIRIAILGHHENVPIQMHGKKLQDRSYGSRPPHFWPLFYMQNRVHFDIYLGFDGGFTSLKILLSSLLTLRFTNTFLQKESWKYVRDHLTTRGWSPKFETGPNVLIGIDQKIY